MKKLKQTNGITLIALIVTIIVLLILAVVSFRVITGDDGILSKATTSTEKHRIAAAEELLNLKKAQIIANAYEEGLKKPDLKYIYDALVVSSDFEVQKVVYKAEAKIKDGIPTEYDFGKVDYILVISDEYKDVTLKIDNDLQTVTRSIGKKIIEQNVEKDPPVISLTADSDSDSPQQKVGVKVMVTDESKIELVKWAKGNLTESYFEDNGNLIQNNSVVSIDENGIYTFYAIDMVGNMQIKTLTIENIDDTPPKIDIQVSPETVGVECKINIAYEDGATNKQYRIGENNTSWTNYTGEITLTSYTVLEKKWQNEDGTVTVYATYKDTAGITTTEKKKILNLDLDAPSTPVINSNYGYPVLTGYGAQLDGETTITFDSRTDITNYYSVDNGTTWNVYTGTFNVAGSGTIKAKSVKKSTGLEVTASKTVSMPGDALTAECYDGNTGTSTRKIGNNYIRVDDKLIGAKINVVAWHQNFWHSNESFQFLDQNKNVISSDNWNGTGQDYSINKTYTIPEGTKWINYWRNDDGKSCFQELILRNEPVINVEKIYPTLTASGVTIPEYCKIKIDYSQAGLQQLYKINDGDWTNYKDGVNLNVGQTLYAKGIDKYGIESKVIPSCTATLASDAMPEVCFDGNTGTSTSKPGNNYILVEDSLIGAKINVVAWHNNYQNSDESFQFLDQNKNIISADYWKNDGQNYSINKTYTIPEGTKWINYYHNIWGSSNLQEIILIK